MTAEAKNLFQRLIGRGGPGLLAESFWSLVLRLAGMVVSFALGIILARYLGPAELGVYGIVIAVALVLSVIAQVGLPALALREVAVAHSRQDWVTLSAVVRTFAIVVGAAGVLLAAVLAAAATAGPALFGANAPAFVIGAALIPLFALTVLVSAQMRALGRVVASQTLEIFVRPLLTAGLCLAIIASSGGIRAVDAVVANVAASGIALLANFYWLRRSLPADCKKSRGTASTGAWIRSAMPLALVDNLKQVDVTYAMVLLGMLAADTEAGFFRVAYSTVVIVVIPLSVLHVSVGPRLATLSADKDMAGLGRLLAISAAAMTAAMFAGLALLLLIGQPLVTLVFGQEYGPSWLPLTLLTGAQLINAWFGVGWLLLSTGGGERQLTASYAVSVPVSLLSAIPLIDLYGAVGAAIAGVIGALIQNLLVWRSVKARFGLDCSLAGAIGHWRRP